MSTVPIFAPDGTLGDIPATQFAAAVKAGARAGVHITSPDGKDGVIPAERTADAVRAGGKIVPIDEQPIKHDGLWSALGSDLEGMLRGIAPPTTQEGVLQRVKMFKEAITGPDPRELAQSVIDRANRGYGPAYAAIAPTAEQVGANVSGMEASAQQGDVGGVLGHALAVPTAMAASEVLGRVAPAAAEATPRVVRAGVKGANKALAAAPKAIGAGVGGAVGAATHIPYAVPVGAAIGAAVGPEILPKIRIPGEGFGLPNRVTGGPASAPGYLESLGRVTGGPAAAPSYAESLGPVQGGPATAPSYAEFQGQLADMNKPAVADMSTVDARMRSLQNKLKRQKAPAPAEEDLVAKGVQSRQAVIDQKLLAELNKTGKDLQVSLESLGNSPALQRFSPEEIEQSSVRLRDAGKISRMQTGGGAHAARYVVMLK